MHSPLSVISSYFLNSFWLTPLLWTAGLFACRVTKRLGSDTTHRIWVLVLFAAVLAPSLPIGLTLLQQTVANPLWSVGASSHLDMRIVSTWSGNPARAALSHRLLTRCGVLYIGLLFVFSGRLLRTVLLTSGIVRRARSCTLAPAFDGVRHEIARCFNVNPAILETDELPGPVTIGVRNPILLLPSGFLQATEPDDFRVAIAHECVHIVRHDFLKNICYQCLSLPIAFHPISWLIKDQIAQSRELLCDQVAVHRSVDPRLYVHALLRLAMLVASSPQPAPLNAIGICDANILEKRVMELRTAKPTVRTAVRLCLLPAGLSLLSAATLASVAAPISSTGVETAQTGNAEQVFHVGKDVSAPVLVRQADPEFPAEYKKWDGKMEGTSEVALVVGASGTPRNVHIVRSFNQAFDKEAVKAVQQYRFKPALHAGKPVSVELLVDVNFQKF